VVGAVWYPDDRRLQPLNFVRMLAELAGKSGTEIVKTRATGIALEAKRVARGVQTEAGVIEADRVVIAAGCWSPVVTQSIGLDIPMQPAKGYSFDIRLERNPHTALLFCEEHVTLTPLNDLARATTGHDFHGYNSSIDPRYFDKMRQAYKTYLASPSIIEEGEPWSGFRPLTPDGLPIIGPSSRIENLSYATGHAGLGITLAPATGDAIASDLLDGSAQVPNEMLPGRFGL
jgi:D-amino-acid dehydrogenase